MESNSLIREFSQLEIKLEDYQKYYRVANSATVVASIMGLGGVAILYFNLSTPVGGALALFGLGAILIAGVTELVDTAKCTEFNDTLKVKLNDFNRYVFFISSH